MGSGTDADTEVRTAEMRGRRGGGTRLLSLAYMAMATCAHEPTQLHSCSKFTTPGCNISTEYSTLYVATFPLRGDQQVTASVTIRISIP